MSVRVDNEKFLRDFRSRVARSKQSLPVITNNTLNDIAKVAVDDVKRASRQEIESLGVVGYEVLTKVTKTKPARFLKNRKTLYGNAESIRMGAIYAAALRKMGIDPKSIPAAEFQARVQKALAARLKSIGFVASSFVPVLRKLAAKLGISAYSPMKVAPVRGAPKGSAKPAVDGWKCEASFEVSAGLNVEDERSRERVRGMLEHAVEKGFAEKSKDWQQYTENELNKVWR